MPLGCFCATVELRGQANTSMDLTGSEPITSPRAGVVVFERPPGDTVAAGDVVARLVDIDSGEITPVCTQSAGVLYARIATRWAGPGDRLAKVAGTVLSRSGKRPSP